MFIVWFSAALHTELKLLISCAFENVLKQHRLEPGHTYMLKTLPDFMKNLTGHQFLMEIFSQGNNMNAGNIKGGEREMKNKDKATVK